MRLDCPDYISCLRVRIARWRGRRRPVALVRAILADAKPLAKFDEPALKIMFQVTQIYVSCLSAVFVVVTLVSADMI